MARCLLAAVLATAALACTDGSGPSEETLRNTIVFRAVIDGQQRLEAVQPDGSNRRPVLTVALPVFPHSPAIAPDGRQLVFNQGSEVWVAEYSGSEVRSLTAGDPGAVSRARWHRDGRTLVVQASGAGSGELERIDAETTTRDTLLSDEAENQTPDWSPDGAEVVFTRFEDGVRDGSLYRLTIASGTLVPLFAEEIPGTERHPRWSHDGRWISFHRTDDPDLDELGAWILDLSSGVTRQVSATGACPCPFSPDSRQLIYYEHEMAGLIGLVRYAIDTEDRILIVPEHERLYVLADPDWGR